MAGHSKWKQIKEKKGKEDKKRSKEFSKFARLISVESRLTSGDTNSSSLRTIIERAKAAGLPKENIERAVLRGTGASGETLEQITYETYGPGGVAIVIDTFTDSKNRTSQELKHLLSEMGYALATPGSAAWAFSKDPEGTWQPLTTVPISDEDTEKLAALVEALEARDDVEHVATNAE
jgi:YebC/PmpR family DNA-binding regulatory protein